jgi:hypothetical protein
VFVLTTPYKTEKEVMSKEDGNKVKEKGSFSLKFFYSFFLLCSFLYYAYLFLEKVDAVVNTATCGLCCRKRKPDELNS